MSSSRRYEFGDSKYWEIAVNGTTTIVSFGAMGAVPRTSERVHGSEQAANKFAASKMREKIRKGYVYKGQPQDEQVPLRDDDAENAPPPSKRAKSENASISAKRAKNPSIADPLEPQVIDNIIDPSTNNKDEASLRRFEFGDPPSKFWEIRVEDENTFITYGQIGANGRSSDKEHKDAHAASKFASKKIKEKLKKGYTEVSIKEDNDGEDDDGM